LKKLCLQGRRIVFSFFRKIRICHLEPSSFAEQTFTPSAPEMNVLDILWHKKSNSNGLAFPKIKVSALKKRPDGILIVGLNKTYSAY